MSSTYCPSLVPAPAARVGADALVEQWAGAARLVNAMSLLPMGIDQGTGLSSTGFTAGDVKRFHSTDVQFTARRGPRVRSGTG